MSKLLIIAYYFPPYPAVGGFRAAGIHRYLAEFGWQTHVVTASAGERDDPTVTRWPLGASAARFSLLKDESARWAEQIRPDLAKLVEKERPDLVLITGGPFLYFKLGPWLQRRFGLPYVLDLRDPFINPRLAGRWWRDAVARVLERAWYSRATALLIPTEAMRGLVQAPKGVPVHVIENGFDDHAWAQREHSVDQVPAGDPLSLIYCGKFYENAYPQRLLTVLQRHREYDLPAGRLVHVGPEVEAITQAACAEGLPLVTEGTKPYRAALDAIEAHAIGVILSGGYRFEVTTKIYDYIALNKPILAIGVEEGSGVHMVLQRYGNYQLCPNEEEAIAGALKRLLAQQERFQPLSDEALRAFGRREQAGRLAAILDRCWASPAGSC